MRIEKIERRPLEEEESKPDYNDLPVLPTRNFVLFPEVSFPINLTREISQRVAESAYANKLYVAVVCQRDPEIVTPDVSDLYDVGVLARVERVIDMPGAGCAAIVSAYSKIKILGPGRGQLIPGVPSVMASPAGESMPRKSDKEFSITLDMIRQAAKEISESEKQNDGLESSFNYDELTNPVLLVNLTATASPAPIPVKIELLKRARLKDRATRLLSALSLARQLISIKNDIVRRTQTHIDEQQRRQFMQAHYETLRAELFGPGGESEDVSSLEKRAEEVKFPRAVRKSFRKELEKLSRMPSQSPDYATQYAYLDFLLSLPWGVYSDLNTDFKEAEKVLERDHYGLEKVKERVLEQLAVMMNTPEAHAPIICLVGAPGVGKTSLGQSIAAALGRKYQRISLGGVHDESEIRGHRRTYIGAMPGRIIDAIRRAGSSNPVLLLDEIDKTDNGVRGDPASALLEVLDPEQNLHFHDNYVDLDYDLSKVLFIATANSLSTIQRPLLDRMEVIDISGYLAEEKIEIARRHLIPRTAAENGFERDGIIFTPEAMMKIIEHYTSESGVRQLEKAIRKIFRAIVLRKMRGLDFPTTVDVDDVRTFLGVERYTPERYEVADTPGVAVGLAWTAVGGEILFIEASFTHGKADRPTLTGNLGDVMKESAVIGLQVVKTHIAESGRPLDWLDSHALHVHVPEGAIPKDGPSAGITIATAIMSALAGVAVKPGLAMTGELTLRGKVLPVGGIKEKILAAKRAGITDIILCADNRKDLEEIRADYLDGLNFHFVKTIADVWSIALPGLSALSNEENPA